MKRYWSEICAALFLAVVINCFGGVIVYASSAEQQITDQMELTDLQSMVDEMLGEKHFLLQKRFTDCCQGKRCFRRRVCGNFAQSPFYGIEREKELIVKLLLLLLFAAVFPGLPVPLITGRWERSVFMWCIFLFLLF